MLHLRGRNRVRLYALALLAAVSLVACKASRAADELPTTVATSQQPPEPTPEPAVSAPLPPAPEADSSNSTDHIVRLDQPLTGEPLNDGFEDDWCSQWAPTGIIY